MKIITLLTSIFVIFFLSGNAWATTNHLEQAIQHTESAISATNGPTIAEHAEMARIHATAARNNAN